MTMAIFNANFFGKKLNNRNQLKAVIEEKAFDCAINGAEPHFYFRSEIEESEIIEFAKANGYEVSNEGSNEYMCNLNDHFMKMFQFRCDIVSNISAQFEAAIQEGRNTAMIVIKDERDRKLVIEKILKPNGFKINTSGNQINISF